MSGRPKTLFETSLTGMYDSDIEGVGTLRQDVAGSWYRWVKNRNATALVADESVCYDIGNIGSVVLFQSVNDPVTADLMVAAGVIMASLEASGSKCFGWVHAQGYHKEAKVLAVSGTAVAVGDELVCANGVGTLTRATAVGTAPKRRFTFVALEVLSAATGATLDRDVYISCL